MQSPWARCDRVAQDSRSTASTEPSSWKSLEQRSKTRFTKPKLTKTLSGSLDSILTSMGLDIKMRFTTSAVQVSGGRRDGEIDNQPNAMPKQILVELPALNNLSNATDVSNDSQTSSNSTPRFTKRSQVMTARATTSATTELTATMTSNRGVHSSTQENSLTSQLHNFSSERRMSNAAAVRSLNIHADASPPPLVRAKHQDRESSPSCVSHVRDLAKNFDAFKTIGKKNGIDKASDHRNERNRMQLDLGKTNGDRRDSSMKVFEQKQSFMSSNKKLVTNDFSTEEATANRKEMTHLREGDNSFKENKVSSDMRACLEMNGIHAEKGISSRQEDRRVRVGDVMHYETSTAALAKAKLSSDSVSAEQTAVLHKRKTLTSNSVGVINKEERNDSALASRVTFGHHQKPVDTPTSPAVTSALDELGRLEKSTNPLDVNQALIRCGNHLSSLVHSLNSPDQQQQLTMFDQVGAVMQLAWSVPDHGYQLGVSLSNTIRQQGGLDTLISSCDAGSKEVERRSARVLSNCLTTENRQYVVERGLIGNVVRTACRTCTALPDSEDSRVGAGILQSLFKHSEGTCSDVVRMGGLDAVLTQCKNKDVPTLRHCAVALANLSLYGGPENQQTMLKRKVPTWLFPLAFHNDDGVKYYACLAIAAMVANKEIEAAVLRSGTLDLVEPFVTSHDPAEFAKSAIPSSGHSKSWLKRLVPILLSDREEARKLAAFHFCMEAGIKVEEGCAQVFDEIGAIEPLRQVASSPNAVASKFAAQALLCLGKEVPIKLSQQVPLWSVDDVANWVQQIDFAGFKNHFINSRVDGDLLFRLNEEMLKDDIGMANGILRKRFMRELNHLKQMADYSSCDTTQLYQFLQSLGPEFSIYTYSMLAAGVDKTCLRFLTDDQLQNECGVNNSIHRLKIHEAIKQDSSVAVPPVDVEKTLDCFISYRRSNGSQLASLLKVHLELRGFSVFIDVERLEAGKFGNNLLNSIYQASNFILVLTPCALDRCIQDADQKDWVRKEINAALKSKCNIVPIIDDFQWPEPEKLPEDMRPICKFNGIRWIHDYQEACVDKLERFMRGEFNRPDARLVRSVLHTLAGTSPSVSRCHSPAVSRGYVSPLLPRRRAAHPPLVMKRSRSLDGQTTAGPETYLRVPDMSNAGFQPAGPPSDDDHSDGHPLYYNVDPYCGQNSDASGSSRDW